MVLLTRININTHKLSENINMYIRWEETPWRLTSFFLALSRWRSTGNFNRAFAERLTGYMAGLSASASSSLRPPRADSMPSVEAAGRALVFKLTRKPAFSYFFGAVPKLKRDDHGWLNFNLKRHMWLTLWAYQLMIRISSFHHHPRHVTCSQWYRHRHVLPFPASLLSGLSSPFKFQSVSWLINGI